MATIASVARERKQQLRELMVASLKLDAAQEKLEREVKRIINRKRSVPEMADAERLTTLAQGVESALASMVSTISSVSGSWGGI